MRTIHPSHAPFFVSQDILHVACAEKFLLAYPAHTAPDGFFCPACHGPFFPPEMVASPVADQLRTTLEGMKDLQKRCDDEI